MAPGIDRGWDRRDAPREPERPEPETTPRDARWAALVDGLPDAVVEPDATAESIAELRRRIRELEAEGHAPQRHEGQVTDRQLQDRVLHGHDPAQEGPDRTVDAVTGQPHERPRIASRFDTPEAMVAAAEAIAMEEGDGKLIARLPLDEALPGALRAQVTGFARAMAGEDAPARLVDFTDGRVQGVYRWDESTRTWSTYTIYPDRRRPSDAGREP